MTSTRDSGSVVCGIEGYLNSSIYSAVEGTSLSKDLYLCMFLRGAHGKVMALLELNEVHCASTLMTNPSEILFNISLFIMQIYSILEPK